MTQPAQLTTMLLPESCFFFVVTRLTPPFSSAADPILRWGRIGTMLLAEVAEELLPRRQTHHDPIKVPLVVRRGSAAGRDVAMALQHEDAEALGTPVPICRRRGRCAAGG